MAKSKIGNLIASLFGISAAVNKDSVLNFIKSSRNFDPGNITGRYVHRSSQAKRRKLERRRKSA
jgi:hypothetical protein